MAPILTTDACVLADAGVLCGAAELMPMAEPAHGTRARYRAGCRCTPCRAANAEYARQLREREDPPTSLVDATEVRERLRAWQARGVGYRRIAALAGVSHQLVFDLRAGRRTQVTTAVRDRILAVRPSLAPGARVQSWPTWHLIYSLEREGFTRRRLAQLLGFQGAKIHFRRSAVTVKNHLLVKRLWSLVMSEDGGRVVVTREDADE